MNINEKVKQDFMLLGQRIKKLREERNLTIKETSQKTGIRPQYLQKIEAGLAYGVMIEKHLVPLAKVFKVKFHELFDLNNFYL